MDAYIAFAAALGFIFKTYINDDSRFPKSFNLWKQICMLPIFTAPFVIIVSAFMFDNPHNYNHTLLFCILLNSYSIILWAGYKLSTVLYIKIKRTYYSLIPLFISVPVAISVAYYAATNAFS